jgi:hypothetical protein
MMNESVTKYALPIALIALALIGRLMPHPHNFTPVLAVALFGGALLRGPMAYLVPIGGMLLSDLLLGHAFTWMTPVIYGCMAGGTALGRWLSQNRTWVRTGLAAVSGSLLFYVVTNFAVWLTGHGSYPHTLEGLLQCYTLALPFFRNGLAGDLFWTALLFGLFDLVRLSIRAHLRVPLVR